ncbi:unnamed protein product [Durusdinium trenchii]|uniref:MYND-type domain-containing protein n=1 Tax=Durusdinium trenchii TaxID=1381693 RepID=A0ABP0S300_9DINO
MAGESAVMACAACGASDQVKRCSVCKQVYYCGRDCQKKDIGRHRQEDGCGSGCSKRAVCPEVSIPFAVPEPATSPKAATKVGAGPPCQRCGHVAAGEVYAEIAARSIFGSPDCKHGPYCQSCAKKLCNLTLAFCSGCNALIQKIAPEEVSRLPL